MKEMHISTPTSSSVHSVVEYEYHFGYLIQSTESHNSCLLATTGDDASVAGKRMTGTGTGTGIIETGIGTEIGNGGEVSTVEDGTADHEVPVRVMVIATAMGEVVSMISITSMFPRMAQHTSRQTRS